MYLFLREARSYKLYQTYTVYPEDFTVGMFSPFRLTDDINTEVGVIREAPSFGGNSFFWIRKSDAEGNGNILQLQWYVRPVHLD